MVKLKRKSKSTVSKSVYAPSTIKDTTQSHTLSILIANEPGALARIIGLFSARGYNIDSLTVAETDRDKQLSRVTIVTSGKGMVLDLIKNKLESLVQVKSVRDLTTHGPYVSRELALIKVAGTKDNRVEALRIADIFRARVVDSTLESFVFEITGESGKIDAFVTLMHPLGLIDVSRSGVAAISRGEKAIGDD